MAVWDYRRFQDSIQKGEKKPLYVLFGDEPFLIQRAVRDLTDMILGDSLRDFNLDVFYAGDAEIQRVRDAVDTLPMMAERRVVVLKEAQLLKAKDFEALIPVVEATVDSTSFILVFSDLDQRLKFSKLALQNGTGVKFERPSEKDVRGWIQKLVQEFNKTIEAAAVESLIQMVGLSLTDLFQELRKLAQYAGDRKVLTLADVQAVVTSTRVDTVFQLADAIGESDRGAALISLANLLDHGENPVGITSLMARHIRILTAVREGLERGFSAGQLSSRAGVPSFFISKYIEQSRRWSALSLRRAQRALLQADRALKSSSVAPHLWLESFVVEACADQNPRI